MAEYLHRLNIYLRGGQTLTVDFKTPKPDQLNEQINEFIKAKGDPKRMNGNFIFQGQRVVMVHLPDVSAADVVVLVKREEPAKPAEAPAA